MKSVGFGGWVVSMGTVLCGLVLGLGAIEAQAQILTFDMEVTGVVSSALPAPTADEATDVSASGFTANWTDVPDASGYRLDVYTGGASENSRLIISQYVDTDSGTTPKGIELFNVSGGTLDFSTTPLVVEKGVNGAAPAPDFTLSSGTLAAGEVMVIGTSDIGLYLTNTFGAGVVVFHGEGFTFNGDDALVIKLGETIEDTIGKPGSDPGTGWSGNGVQTWNQNISLLAGIRDGETNGWTDPSLRFETVSSSPSAGDGLSGFGEAPFVWVTYIEQDLAVPDGETTSYALSGLDPDTLYSYRVRATNATSTSENSNVRTVTTDPPAGLSDIMVAAGFTELSNLAYLDYQADDITGSGDSLELARFTIRDGGGSGSDADASATTLTNLTVAISNPANLRRVALYDGATELAEAAAAGSVTFTELSVAAPDNGSTNLSIRATFAGSVTDNEQVGFTITAADADPAGSGFAAADAGAAASSLDGDRNRIEVTATALAVASQPSSIYANEDFSLTLQARDALGNVDLDSTASISISKINGMGSLSGGDAQSLASGEVVFPALQVTEADAYTLRASADGLTAADTDAITAAIRPGMGTDTIVLTGASYTEDFNAIATVGPVGVRVFTNATINTLGTQVPYEAGVTAWGDSEGRFSNQASTNGLTATSDPAAQHASADRALGIRQSENFGDPGAAFVFVLDHTRDKLNIQVRFDLLMLYAHERQTSWVVDYRVGESGSFTPLESRPTGSATDAPGRAALWGGERITVALGADANHASSRVYIRVVALDPATGSGSRDTVAVDNLEIGWQPVTGTIFRFF